MNYRFGREKFATLEQAESHCFLLTNGLGGFTALTVAGSVNRCDHGLLMAALTPPNVRAMAVHRLEEVLTVGDKRIHLSTQRFGAGRSPEEGYRHLSQFTWAYGPQWTYEVQGVAVTRRLALLPEHNTVAVCYQVNNRSEQPVTFTATPWLQCVPKGEDLSTKQSFVLDGTCVMSGGISILCRTDGVFQAVPTAYQTLAYPVDQATGGREAGMVAAAYQVTWPAAVEAEIRGEIILSTEPITMGGEEIIRAMQEHREAWSQAGQFRDPLARQLAQAAGDFVAWRASTQGMTLMAGYPFFGDWGRDTMVALPGCCLATGRYDLAKSILRTFLKYERRGLIPNLFPEGTEQPRYNTMDAPLLLIHGIWYYYEATGDMEFLQEAYPVLERIVEHYQKGTDHAIVMEADGLVRGGSGLDQLTWMDVCVNGHLPTPRQGKPVEINAYWYNALCMMERFAQLLGNSREDYGGLANRVKNSFRAAFWRPEAGCLKDVLTGGTGEEDQIRCNQIWAVSLPFSLLELEQEAQVVETVQRHLFTPLGLRTLSPQDPAFHPVYEGPQAQRDLAYHQGTVWPFPLGGFYLAYLKVHGNSPEAVRQVRQWLKPLAGALEEGCLGQLPEIYDGLEHGTGKGCFAQAWSVGELLRVCSRLEQLENRGEINCHEAG